MEQHLSTLAIKFSPDDYAKIQAISYSRGLQTASFVRMILYEIIKKDYPALEKEFEKQQEKEKNIQLNNSKKQNMK